MQRRAFALLASAALGATTGCLAALDGSAETATAGRPNCETRSRDATIDELTKADEDDRFTLAGEIVETNDDGRWVLVHDGTGVAKVSAESSPAGDALVDHPQDDCIQFSGRVGNVPDHDDGRLVQISMYLGELVTPEAAATPTDQED
ncbi:hypothetical protein G9C85_17140 [Halorubellus sp. JP-L1]|uniref:hypothetical protein n=1 Tax=Halorubellus sp. JP-L1 TaxID=2715753 RepID=UPI00140C9C2D|nr:hypothetical protein [Halorubellus sp. JP-L1]NHN43344.1 hypothetical protein [Halorubellus sp. JP-L1]